ncbi:MULTISPECIES: hypothetical protein [Leifsonia]|uniref:Uncharacterized protein n=1 Tax=Leifsonia soli TaxID=582665 RepID=A0A852SVE6_9MICO|nr:MULTISPECIES: hypothetical protein [Leifsonia]NYD73036.1 hypothetical protein [Leifsonia soli]SEA92573.1 hypothetical protein SAMN04515680_2163 [Leifsonia sp. 21MFCrub1.1]
MNRLRFLRSPSPAPRPRRLAYRVPWRVDRSTAPHYRLINAGRETLSGVTVSVAGSASLRVSPPTSVSPGEAVRASVSGREPARDTVLVVRWFPPDGREYLWQISL